MDARAFNRRELAAAARGAGLVVAAYAAAWLLFSYRGSRVAPAECEVVRRAGDECALEHRAGGEARQTPWQSCLRVVWSAGSPRDRPPPASGDRERWATGARRPCFYYVNDPGDIFLEPRSHPWATPAPLAVAAAGALVAAAAQLALARSRTRPAPPPAPPDEGPYRRAAERLQAPPPPPLAPLTIALNEYHGADWFVGGPFLALGAALFGLTLLAAWEHGGPIGPFFLFALSAAHGALALGALSVFFRRALHLLPDRGLLVYEWRIGPRRLRRAYALSSLASAAHCPSFGARHTSHYLDVERLGGLPPLRWGVASSASGQAHADAINALLGPWQQRPPGNT